MEADDLSKKSNQELLSLLYGLMEDLINNFKPVSRNVTLDEKLADIGMFGMCTAHLIYYPKAGILGKTGYFYFSNGSTALYFLSKRVGIISKGRLSLEEGLCEIYEYEREGQKLMDLFIAPKNSKSEEMFRILIAGYGS